jgi:hypothetical protein
MGKGKIVNRVSKQRRPAFDTYRKESKAWLISNSQCEGCRRSKATEVHHKFGRLGPLLNWKPGWIALCKKCHQFAHEHPQAARECGLLAPFGQWNKTELAKGKA